MLRRHSPRIGRPRLWLLIGAVVLICLVAVPVVSAHANLVDSSPARGEQVEDPPQELVLTYSEGVQIADVSVESADGDRIDGDARIDETDRAVVRVPLDDADNGTYIVQWEVLSVDGHTTRGSFFFVVGDELPTREQILATYGDDQGGYSLTVGEPVFRSAYLAGTIVLVGAPLTLLFAVYPPARRHRVDIEAADRRTRWLFCGTLLVLLVSATGLALVQFPTPRTATVGFLRGFLETELGQMWLVQAGAILGLGLVSIVHFRRPDRIVQGSWLAGLVVGGLVLGLLMSWTSHSAAAVDPTIGGVVDFAHLVGAALWAGGLFVFAIITPAYGKRADDAPALVARQLRRFFVLAVAGVALAGATGLAIAAWHVPTVDALRTTLYGGALSVKALLVLVAIGFGGFNRYFLGRYLLSSREGTRDPEPVWTGPGSLLFGVSRRLRAGGGTVQSFVLSVRVELVVLIAVLVLSGLLTSIPTAANVTTSGGDPNEHVFESEVEGGDLTLRVVPGHVGPNVFDVTIADDGAAVETDEPVTLILRNADRGVRLPEVELDRIDSGIHSTVEPIPSAGTWEVRVTTWIDGTYVSERYTMNVSSAAADHEAADHESQDPGDGESQDTGDDGIERAADTRLETVLRIGAVGFAIVGVSALGYEVRRLRRRRRRQ